MRMSRLLGLTRPASTERSRTNSGWWTTYWSRGLLVATRTVSDRSWRRPARQALLDGAPLFGQIAAAVAAHGVGGGAAQVLAEVGDEQLDGDAAAGENDGLGAGFQELAGQVAGSQDGVVADAEGGVLGARVVEEEVAWAGGGAVVVDQGDGLLHELLGELAGVRDGGGGEQELRSGTIEGRDALQPPDDVGQVGAEDAAVGV
jgi:hypothetical protein